MRCHHYCNTVRCWTCIGRFYAWAQNWTRRGDFYVAAARFVQGGES